MVDRVASVSSFSAQAPNTSMSEKDLFIQARKDGLYRVGPKETLSTIAKRFGVDNYKTFMKLIGRSESKTSLSKGEELKGLKTVTCKQGQGLSALARAADMTLDNFCKLNGIDKNYVPKSGEKFFRAFTNNEIKKVTQESSAQKTPVKPNNTPSPEVSDSEAKKTVQDSVKPNVPPKNEEKSDTITPEKTTPPSVVENKKKWGSDYTPTELGRKIYKFADENSKAVGRPDFDALIEQINPKNAKEVIAQYNNNPDNKSESLISTITSETGSKPEDRKGAVMHIYDALAESQGTDPKVREGFVKELNEQFESFGMVDTDKMDRTIKRMTSTPEELAKDFQSTFKEVGAVGRDSFDELINFVTSKNAAEVIKAYDKLSPDESLMNAIASEYWSDDDKCKQAMSDVFHALAEQKGLPKSEVEKFDNELKLQYDSMYVLTDKLDEMVEAAVGEKSKTTPSSDPSKISVTPSITTDNTGKIKAYDGKFYPKLEVPKCGYFVGDSKNPNVSRNSSARPPIPVDSKGNVVAEVIKFSPSNTASVQDLKGKTIMLNAGHGWGKTGKGQPKFDRGAAYNDAKGKTLEEWYKNRNLADDVIKELTARGATVIYTTGTAAMACQAKEKYKADLLISLHCDAVANKGANGLKMIYHAGNSDSKAFATEVDTQISTQYNHECKTVSDKETSHKYLGLIDEGNRQKVPAVLCEMGFMSNPTDIANIDSGGMQAKAAKALGDACVAYLK